MMAKVVVAASLFQRQVKRVIVVVVVHGKSVELPTVLVPVEQVVEQKNANKMEPLAQEIGNVVLEHV